MTLKFYASVAKGLKLKVRKFWGLVFTFVKVTRRNLIGVGIFVLLPPSWISLKQRLSSFKGKKEKGTFSAAGPNWIVSLDDLNKFMSFQKSTFLLATYGCIDSTSRKILFIKVWTSNSNPNFVAQWYFEYLYKSKILPNSLRIDKSTETATLFTMHVCLSSF